MLINGNHFGVQRIMGDYLNAFSTWLNFPDFQVSMLYLDLSAINLHLIQTIFENFLKNPVQVMLTLCYL